MHVRRALRALCLAGASLLPAACSVLSGGGPSEAASLEFARGLERALNARDGSSFDAALDLDGILDAAAAGSSIPDPAARSVRGQVKESICLGKRIAGIVAGGGTCRLLRLHAPDGRPRVLFRIVDRNGGLDYHDWLLALDAKPRIADVYVYRSGEGIREAARRGFPALAWADGTVSLEGLSAPDRAAVDASSKVRRMRRLAQDGRSREALELFAGLPPALRANRTVLFERCRVAALAGEKELSEALDAAANAFPGDPAVDLLRLDTLLTARRLSAALEAADRLGRAVGGDPYLDVLRGNIHVVAGDRAAAKASFGKAIEAEPTLRLAHEMRILVSIKDRAFPETAAYLTTMEAAGLAPPDLLADPQYAPFLDSPEGKAWFASRRKRHPAPPKD